MWLQLVSVDDWVLDARCNFHQIVNAHRLPFIAMKTADEGIVPWLASQTDVLAEDWGEVK